VNTNQDDYEGGTGSLGSILADPCSLAEGRANKRECELLVIEYLATVTVEITPLGQSMVLRTEAVPDSGAMVYGHTRHSCRRGTVDPHKCDPTGRRRREAQNPRGL
jgi:hypothetical protein